MIKVYQESHERMEIINNTIVEASKDTGARYGVKKCAEAEFKHGKMMKATGLEVLEEKMKGLDPNNNERYKFLGCEQSNGIDVDPVLNRVSATMKERMEKILKLNL